MAGDVPSTLDWRLLWEDASGRYAKRLCLRIRGRSLTYLELDDVSQQFAGLLLKAKGWTPGALVALPVDCPDFFLKLLAVWHAGGVAVPTMEKLTEFEFLWDRTHPCRIGKALSSASPDWHALYRTSGSTGQPRAVVRGWKQAIYEAGHYAGIVGLTEGMTCTMLINPVFGASTKHFLGCLLSGCFQSLPFRGEGSEFRDGDLIHGTPSQMITQGESGDSSRYGLVSLTGEPLSRRAVEAVRGLCRPNGCYLNALGGSETGVLINRILAKKELLEGEQTVLSGLGLPGKNLRIVDENGDQVLSGETGLLEVSSEWIAEGYLDGTGQSLQFTPFSQSEGKRVFRTGDLVVREPNGWLRHLGRSGSMIKHRGKWLDTSPLRDALMQEGSDVVHIGRSRAGSGLKVWIHLRDAKIDSLEHLASKLCDRLGDSPLLPETLVSLSETPLNAHGKTDLGALEKLETGGGVCHFRIPSRVVRMADAIANQRWDDPVLGGAFRVGDLHLDSLELHEMLVELEHLTGRTLSRRTLDGGVALREIFSASTHDHVIPYQCMGTSGGTVLLWFGDGVTSVRRELKNDLRILHWNITIFPGPGGSRDVRSLAALAKKMLGFVDVTELGGNIVVGGYSFGALLAREAAVILRDRGVTVSGVLLLDPPDPGRHHIRKALRWSRWRPSLVSAILGLLPSSCLDALGGMLRVRFCKETHRHREEQRRCLMRSYRPSMSGELREILVTSRAEHLGSVKLLSCGVSKTEIFPLDVAEHLQVLTDSTARMLWIQKLKHLVGDSPSVHSG